MMAALRSAALLTLFAALTSCAFFAPSSDRDVLQVAVDFSRTTVHEVDFSAAETVVASLSGLHSKTLILEKINSGVFPAAAAETGTAVLSIPTGGTSDSSRSVQPARSASERPPRRPHPIAAAESERSAAAARALSSRGASSRETAAAVPYGATAAQGALPVGSAASFWVDYAPGRFDTVAATLRKVTDHTYIWVADASATDNGWASSPFAEGADFGLKLDLLADAFESVVFPAATAVHGYERGGGQGGDGGIDGDQHISIFLYDIDFDSDASDSDGYVAGYFWPKDDMLPNATNVSNGREIFYLDAWALDQFPYTIVSTLAHEYQHMINYNMEAYGNRAGASTWLNEFRSLATEDLLAPAFEVFSAARGYAGSAGAISYDYFEDGPGYWIGVFNNNYRYAGGLGFWDFATYDYAFASVFASYLLRAYGGIWFMEDLIAGADAGQGAETAFAAAISAAADRTVRTDGSAPAAGAALSVPSFYADILEPFAFAVWGFGANGAAGNSPLTRSDAAAVAVPAFTARPLRSFAVLDLDDPDSILPRLFTLGGQTAIEPRSFAFHSDAALIGIEGDTATMTFTAPSNTAVRYRLLTPGFQPATSE